MWVDNVYVVLIPIALWFAAASFVGAWRYDLKPLYLVTVGALLMLVGGLGELGVPLLSARTFYLPARMVGTLLVSLVTLSYAGHLAPRGIDGRKVLYFRDARIPRTDQHDERPLP